MRQRLQERTDRLGDLKTRAKKLSEDAVVRREQLCVKIRTLSGASKALEAARSNLKVLTLWSSKDTVSQRPNQSATQIHGVLCEVASCSLIDYLTFVRCTLKHDAWCSWVHKMLILQGTEISLYIQTGYDGAVLSL